MTPLVFALVAAAAAATASVPALADYVRIGSVDVGLRMDRDSAWSRFGGGMEGLRLIASRFIWRNELKHKFTIYRESDQPQRPQTN